LDAIHLPVEEDLDGLLEAVWRETLSEPAGRATYF
jgi:hypothetical protein